MSDVSAPVWIMADCVVMSETVQQVERFTCSSGIIRNLFSAQTTTIRRFETRIGVYFLVWFLLLGVKSSAASLFVCLSLSIYKVVTKWNNFLSCFCRRCLINQSALWSVVCFCIHFMVMMIIIIIIHIRSVQAPSSRLILSHWVNVSDTWDIFMQDFDL